MNGINFTARLVVDSDLKKSLKNSPVDEIVAKTREVVENPVVSKLIDEDEVVLSRMKGVKGEGLIIKFKNKDIEINLKRPIRPEVVLYHILMWICFKNNADIRSGSPMDVLDAFQKLAHSRFSKNDK